jgi:glycosyl transferase family 25
VINLDRSADRLAAVTRTLHALGLPFERIEAVDGGKLSGEEISQLASNNGFAFFKPLTRGEIGCALSHRRALERVVELGCPCALILEDDFALQEDVAADGGARFRDVLAALSALGTACPDAVNLFGRRPRGAIVRTLGDSAQLLRSVSPPVGNVAVFWTQTGARKFLGQQPPFRRPVDVDRKHWWERNLDACWISPPPCTEGRALGQRSTIGARQSSGLGSRCRKLIYRGMFAVQSQWHFFRMYGVARWLRAQQRVQEPA